MIKRGEIRRSVDGLNIQLLVFIQNMLLIIVWVHLINTHALRKILHKLDTVSHQFFRLFANIFTMTQSYFHCLNDIVVKLSVDNSLKRLLHNY